MRSVTFRTAALADADALVRLIESAYRGEASRKGWTTEADLLGGQRTDSAEVSALLCEPKSRFLLAVRDGEIIGCAHLMRAEAHGYFGLFAVSPLVQGGGVGSALLAAAEHLVRVEWRLAEVRMQVISVREDLIAYYLRRGYRGTGRYSPFPYGDERFGRPRRDDLRFELLIKELRAA